MAEVMVALLLATALFMLLTNTAVSSLNAVREARAFDQATSVGRSAIEAARNVSYDQLATGATSKEALPTCGGAAASFDPDGSGAFTCETVVWSSSGLTTEYTQTVGPRSYRVRRYVTWVDETTQGGAGQDYKRVVVLVAWAADGGQPRSYRISTLVTPA